jgi:hypothetical protein
VSEGHDPPPNWRERVRRIGNQAFIREEMERLGFWTPESVRSEQAAAALAELRATTGEPRVSRAHLRRFRAFLHHCETEGLPAVSQRIGQNAMAYAAGYLSFLHMVCPEQEERIRQSHPWIERRPGASP